MRTLSRFFLTLFISVFIMGIPMAITMSYLAPSRSSLSTQRAEAQVSNLYRPDRGDALTVLFAALSADGSPDHFTLVHTDPMRQTVAVFTLPADLLVEAADGLTSLAEAYTVGGMASAAACLGETADIYIHRYGAVSLGVIGNLVDAAGAIEMTLPVGIDVPEAGAHIEAGRQRLGGTRIRAMITYRDYPGGEEQRLSLLAEAMLLLSERYVLGFGSSSGERLFNAFTNTLSESSLTFADFEYRRLALEYLHGLEDIAAVGAAVDTVAAEGGRLLSSTGLHSLQSACYSLSGW